MGAFGASGGSIANQLDAKGFGSERKTAEPATSGKKRKRGGGVKRKKARVWRSLMRRKGSVVVMNEGAGWGSGVAVVDGSDRCRREEVAILLASGWISGGGKDGNAAGRRSGSGAGRAWPR